MAEPTQLALAASPPYRVMKISANDTNKFVVLVDPIDRDLPLIQVIEIFDINGATPPNQHRFATEVFYVLFGEGEAILNQSTTQIRSGSTVVVPHGCTHVIRNTGSTRLYCLTTMVPNEGFAELIASGHVSQLDETDYLALGWTRAR